MRTRKRGMAEHDLIFRGLSTGLRPFLAIAFSAVKRMNEQAGQENDVLRTHLEYWHSLNITRGRTWEKLCVHSSACTIRASWVLFTQWPCGARRAYDRSVSARVCERITPYARKRLVPSRPDAAQNALTRLLRIEGRRLWDAGRRTAKDRRKTAGEFRRITGYYNIFFFFSYASLRYDKCDGRTHDG